MKQSLGSHTYLPATPVLLVGTYDADNKPNLMTAAWGGICCSEPKCIAVSLRKATYSYAAILARQAFTVGLPHTRQLKEADYIGIASGREVNKFEKTGFTPVRSSVVDAPFAEEIPLILECKLFHHAELGLHTLFVGEIMDVKADAESLDEQGRPIMSRLSPFVFNSIDRNYYPVSNEATSAFVAGRALMK